MMDEGRRTTETDDGRRMMDDGIQPDGEFFRQKQKSAEMIFVRKKSEHTEFIIYVYSIHNKHYKIFKNSA